MADYTNETKDWIRKSHEKIRPFGHCKCRKGIEIVSTILDQDQNIGDTVIHSGFVQCKIVNKTIRPILRFPIVINSRDNRIRFDNEEASNFHIPVEGTGRGDAFYNEEEFTRKFEIITDGIETLTTGEDYTISAKSVFHCKSKASIDESKKRVTGEQADHFESVSFNELVKIKERLDERATNHVRTVIAVISFIMVMLFFGFGLITQRFELWDQLESWTFFLGLIFTIGLYGIAALTNRKWSPNGIYKSLLEKQKRKNYLNNGFDIIEFNKINAEISTRPDE